MLETEKQFIDHLLKIGTNMPSDAICKNPTSLIKSLRKRLRMTQKQLAKRVKLPQSYIAKIESGKVIPSLETLEKIFLGFKCNLSFVIIPTIPIDEIIKNQAYLAAKKNLKYISGTMALEDQLPTKDTINDLIKAEQKKLIDSKTSKIWDLND